jgi:GNAT superfamily N-acetyltransferase
LSGYDASVDNRGDFEFSADPARIDLDRVESFLRQSYWAPNRPRDVIEKSLRSSLCLGVHRRADGLQAAFCRVVTDFATFGWVCDVFVDSAFRAHGIGTAMLETLVNLPELAGLRLILATRDAHSLYEKFGFEPLPQPERWMIRRGPDD